jgi:hypothetical protein
MAASKSIPLPDKLAINTNTRGIPTNFAKYLGAWELVRGWGEGKGRDGLLIVMTVDDKGHAAGLYAAGPPKKEELTRNPEFYRRVEGVISDEGFTAQAGTWQYKFVLAGDDVLFGRGEGPGVGGTVQARGHLRRIQ